jgi:hypothetical protein
MTNKNREAEVNSSASRKSKTDSGALEIDCERRTGKLNTGKVRPGQLLEVNRQPIQSIDEKENGVRASHSKDGEEIVQ